jgi:hypothetical protein
LKTNRCHKIIKNSFILPIILRILCEQLWAWHDRPVFFKLHWPSPATAAMAYRVVYAVLLVTHETILLTAIKGLLEDPSFVITFNSFDLNFEKKIFGKSFLKLMAPKKSSKVN